MSGKTNIKCPNCSSKNTIKKGIRKNKLQTIQKYKCKDCSKTFTLSPVKHKSYPIKAILNSIRYYNLGYTQKEASKLIAKKYKTKVPQKTISNWLKEYKNICTYSKLREEAIKQYNPQNIIFSQTFHHIQPYTFKCHKAKLDILTKENPKFAAIKNYIEKINSKDAQKPTDKNGSVSGTHSAGFPHHIFTYNKDNNKKANEQRASQLKFDYNNIEIISKTNHSNELAKLALNLAKSNNERHQAIQDFMLINDSTTIATEIPIYLTNWDAGYYRNQKGFIFPLNNYKTPITGHIDILQIRNGIIHILDYKPEAEKISATEQLTIYALALSRKLNLQLYHFKAAWFDENNYFEFFPLHAVYTKR